VARTVGLAVAAAVGTLLACELLLQLLPVATATQTGYHADPAIFSYPPHHRFTMSTGWDLRNSQHLQANNMGFVARHDFVGNANAVALIGDSFVEASMLAAADRADAQLERSLGAARPVYGMGGPGSALLDYAERIRWAVRHFEVRDIVVLMERGDVRQSLCGSGNVHFACLDRQSLAPRTETLPAPGIAKRWLRHSALAQYLFGQLKVEPTGLWRKAIEQSRPAATPLQTHAAGVLGAAVGPAPGAVAGTGGRSGPPADIRLVDAVTDRFFDRIDGQVAGRLIIVLDSDRGRLRQHLPIDDPERRHFIERARAHGATVVDTEALFTAHYARSSLRLEVGPYDSHLNPLGLRLAMAAAANALTGRAP
jgi:hypothetical protein